MTPSNRGSEDSPRRSNRKLARTAAAFATTALPSPTYTVQVMGPGEAPLPLTGPILEALFHALARGVRGAVRLSVEGRSFGGGPTPAWLYRASLFDLRSVDRENSELLLGAPLLGVAVSPELPEAQLLDDTTKAKSGLSLYAEGLKDAITQRVDSDAFDDNLLNTFQDLAPVFENGATGIQFANNRPDVPALSITAESVREIDAMKQSVPPPQFVRVSGMVDTMRHSDRAFILQLSSGVQVRAIADEGLTESLPQFWGAPAVVSGMAVFRASGRLLRIDAKAIDVPTIEERQIWGTIPVPLTWRTPQKDLLIAQSPRTGVAAFYGKWPGDESDEDFMAVLNRVL